MEQLEADEEEGEEEKEGSTSLDVVTRCGDETDDTQHKTDAVWPRSLIRGVELSTMTTIAWWSSARAGDANTAEVSAEVSARLRRIIWQLQVACFFYGIPATTTTNHNTSNSPTHLDYDEDEEQSETLITEKSSTLVSNLKTSEVKP